MNAGDNFLNTIEFGNPAYFLRGFQNLKMDFATDNEDLLGLVEMLHDYKKKLIAK